MESKTTKLLNTHHYTDLDVSELDSRLAVEDLESRLELSQIFDGTCSVHMHSGSCDPYCINHCQNACGKAPW